MFIHFTIRPNIKFLILYKLFSNFLKLIFLTHYIINCKNLPTFYKPFNIGTMFTNHYYMSNCNFNVLPKY